MIRATQSLFIASLATGIVAILAFNFRAPKLIPFAVGVTLFAAVAMGTIYYFRKVLSEKALTLLFLVQIFILHAFVISNHSQYIVSNRIIDWFVGEKILALFIAILAPPRRWLGFLTLISTAAVPFGLYYSWPLEHRERLPVQEPWITLVLAIACIILYNNQLKGRELEKRAAALTAKTSLLQRFAFLLINAQNLANSPLQTIENVAALVKEKHPSDREMLEPLERALTKVREVVQLFSFCDSMVPWTDMKMPDSVEELKKSAESLLQETQHKFD